MTSQVSNNGAQATQQNSINSMSSNVQNSAANDLNSAFNTPDLLSSQAPNQPSLKDTSTKIMKREVLGDISLNLKGDDADPSIA